MQLVLKEDQELLHRAGHSIGLVDHQRVARLQRLHHGTQLRTLPPSARGLHDHLTAVRTRERVELQLMILARGTDPAVADSDGVGVGDTHTWIVPVSVPELNRRGLF